MREPLLANGPIDIWDRDLVNQVAKLDRLSGNEPHDLAAISAQILACLNLLITIPVHGSKDQTLIREIFERHADDINMISNRHGGLMMENQQDVMTKMATSIDASTVNEAIDPVGSVISHPKIMIASCLTLLLLTLIISLSVALGRGD